MQEPHNALLILGMHRSGTSAMTRVVNLLGIPLNRELLPPKAGDNDRGFWESEAVLRLHEEALAALGSSWSETVPLPEGWWRRHEVAPMRGGLLTLLREEFGEAPWFAVKDPRLCRLLPLWRDLLYELRRTPHCISIVRNPAEVVDSLMRRSGLPPGLGYPLWLDHVLRAELDSRGLPRVFVRYDDLLRDWPGTVARIAHHLDLSWPLTPEEAAPAIDAFLSVKLRHHSLPERTVHEDGELSAQIGRVYDELITLCECDETPPSVPALDAIRAELDSAERLFGRALADGRGQLASLRREIEALEREADRLERHVASLESHVASLESQVAQKDLQISHTQEICDTTLRVKDEEIAQAHRTLEASVQRKDIQILATNELLEARTQELERARASLSELQVQLAEARGARRAP